MSFYDSSDSEACECGRDGGDSCSKYYEKLLDQKLTVFHSAPNNYS